MGILSWWFAGLGVGVGKKSKLIISLHIILSSSTLGEGDFFLGP